MQTDINRRQFLQGLGLIGCCTFISWPQLLLASVPTDKRLLVVVLRGAMDGLGAVPPIGDRDYMDARKGLGMDNAGLLALDGHFAMHEAMAPMHAMYKSGELLVLHASATPYRDRSHFDAQDLLENGSSTPHGLKTGWLGRAVDLMGGTSHALAIGPNVPLILQGDREVPETWAPSRLQEVDEDFLARVAYMYKPDPVLANALAAGMNDVSIAGGKNQFADMMNVTAQFMAKPDGARVAAIDIGGWDTHAGQGKENGRLAQALKNLSSGIDVYKKGMGPLWKDTVVLAMTEFGRTVAMNGTGGTDHGTATASFLCGGRVAGGKVIGDWPGLGAKNLYEGRDLFPVNDLRCLQKAVLVEHLGMDAAQVDAQIFPNSTKAPAYKGLFRQA